MDISSKFKKSVLEPKIFALLVKSPAGQILHLGAHFTLEEAYAIASKKVEQLPSYKPGDMVDIDLWNSFSARTAIIQLMDPIKVDEILKSQGEVANEEVPMFSPAEMEDLPPLLQELLKNAKPITGEELKEKILSKREASIPQKETEPVITDYVQHAKDAKNDLMKKLIEDGNIEAVEEVKSLLGAHSRKYVLKEIEKKNAGSNNNQ